MAGWMKKTFSASGVTEHPVGPEFARLQAEQGGRSVAVLLLDVSGSMSHHLPNAVSGSREFLREAVAGGYHVGLILWNDEICGASAISRDPTQAERLLHEVEAGGGTRLAGPLLAAESLVGDAGLPGQADVWSTWGDKVIAIFGDGALHDQERAESVSAELRGKGVRILARGLGSRAAEALRRIATPEESGVQSAGEVSAQAVDSGIAEMARGLALGRRRRP